jgi:hypothetical protein
MREKWAKMPRVPLLSSPWALFIGEVESVVYILFYWWGEML